MTSPRRHWSEFTPLQALQAGLDLSVATDIDAPVNEMGDRCPWPWEPQQYTSAAMGQYHCPYCGAMVLAGRPHLDYS